MGVQNAKHIEPFYPQRLICRNPLCASRQRAPGILGGETHVLLPDSVTPRSNLRSEDIDLITDIHQLLHDMDEEDKEDLVTEYWLKGLTLSCRVTPFMI